MVFLGKNLHMSKVASIGYCIEVVGKEGQGVLYVTFVKSAARLRGPKCLLWSSILSPGKVSNFLNL